MYQLGIFYKTLYILLLPPAIEVNHLWCMIAVSDHYNNSCHCAVITGILLATTATARGLTSYISLLYFPLYKFINWASCFRWLADDEDDGAIIREVFADSEAALLRSAYNISILCDDE